MRLGKCLDLTVLTPNIVQGGGATSTWTAASASHGTWEVHFPPGRYCPGGDPGSEIDPYASCVLKFRGCGRVHLTAVGTSGAVVGRPYGFSQLFLRGEGGVSIQDAISVIGSTGGVSCDSVGLVGDDDVTFQVVCGMQLVLQFDGFGAFTAPASDITFDVKIVP